MKNRRMCQAFAKITHVVSNGGRIVIDGSPTIEVTVFETDGEPEHYHVMGESVLEAILKIKLSDHVKQVIEEE